MRKKKHIRRAFIFPVLVSVVLMFSVCPVGALDPAAAPESESEDRVTVEDIDRTIDKAINVLSVIREELRETEERTAAVPAYATEAESMAATAGKWIARVNRMWRNLQKAVYEDDGRPRDDISREEDVIDVSELGARIGQAIDMMAAVRTELEKESLKEKEENGT